MPKVDVCWYQWRLSSDQLYSLWDWFWVNRTIFVTFVKQEWAVFVLFCFLTHKIILTFVAHCSFAINEIIRNGQLISHFSTTIVKTLLIINTPGGTTIWRSYGDVPWLRPRFFFFLFLFCFVFVLFCFFFFRPVQSALPGLPIYD